MSSEAKFRLLVRKTSLHIENSFFWRYDFFNLLANLLFSFRLHFSFSVYFSKDNHIDQYVKPTVLTSYFISSLSSSGNRNFPRKKSFPFRKSMHDILIFLKIISCHLNFRVNFKIQSNVDFIIKGRVCMSNWEMRIKRKKLLLNF